MLIKGNNVKLVLIFSFQVEHVVQDITKILKRFLLLLPSFQTVSAV